MKKIGLSDLKRYYDEVYYDSDAVHSRQVGDYKVFLDYLHPGKGSWLLDVSCGTGLLLEAAEIHYDCHLCGMDLSERAIFAARERQRSRNLQVANSEALPYKDGSFDYITNIGSLEHYLDPGKGLDELIRVCRPGGKLCIVLPNYYYLLNILHAFWKGDHLKGHHQINERLEPFQGWLRFLSRDELSIEKVYQDKGPKQPPVFQYKKPSKILKRLIKRLLLFVMPKNLTYQFVFICRRKNSS